MDNVNNIEIIEMHDSSQSETPLQSETTPLQSEIHDPLQSEIYDSLQSEINDPLLDKETENDANSSIESYLSEELPNKRRNLSSPFRQYLKPSDCGFLVCCSLCALRWKNLLELVRLRDIFLNFIEIFTINCIKKFENLAWSSLME